MLLPSYVLCDLYSTNEYSCVRPVHTLYISYFIEHNGDDEPRDYKRNLFFRDIGRDFLVAGRYITFLLLT